MFIVSVFAFHSYVWCILSDQVMEGILFLIILQSLPALVVPIHNISSGGVCVLV